MESKARKEVKGLKKCQRLQLNQKLNIFGIYGRNKKKTRTNGAR